MKKDMKFNQFIPWIILLCCLILVIGFFIPSFKFSCSGYGFSYSVSALQASFGVSTDYGSYGAMVYPLLLLILPIGVAVICFIRKIKERIKAIIVAASFTVELIIYIILACVAASIAREMGCKEAVTAMWVINLIFSIVGICAGVFLIFEDKFMGMINSPKPAAAVPAQAPPQAAAPRPAAPAPAPVPAAAPAPQAPAAGQIVCPNCGTPQNLGGAFCFNCGSPLPKEPPVPKTPVCPGCGQELTNPDAAFCVYCGTKLK